MKTKRKTNGPLPGFRETPQEAAERENAQDAETNASAKRERFNLSFDLKEDGSPDFSSMRAGTKEKVRQFLSDPQIAAEFGARSPAQAEVQIFHPEMVKGMYAMLGAFEAMAVARMTNIPEPIAKQVFTYTPAEIEALTGPTVRVLNKYVADWMIKYQDEIALAMLLGSLTVTKVNLALLMAKKMREQAAPQSQAQTDESGKKEGAGTAGPIQ